MRNFTIGTLRLEHHNWNITIGTLRWEKYYKVPIWGQAELGYRVVMEMENNYDKKTFSTGGA